MLYPEHYGMLAGYGTCRGSTKESAVSADIIINRRPSGCGLNSKSGIQKETNDPGPGQTVSALRTVRNAGNMTDGGGNATLWLNIHKDRLANHW